MGVDIALQYTAHNTGPARNSSTPPAHVWQRRAQAIDITDESINAGKNLHRGGTPRYRTTIHAQRRAGAIYTDGLINAGENLHRGGTPRHVSHYGYILHATLHILYPRAHVLLRRAEAVPIVVAALARLPVLQGVGVVALQEGRGKEQRKLC